MPCATMEESEVEQEIETLKAIWPELQDRPPVWNSPAIAVPVSPLGSLDAKRPTRVTVVVIFNPRYPKVPPRLELESPSQLDDDEVAKLKHMLEAKASEVAGTGMVMVHDLLVLTNDFLSDKNRADEERSRGRGSGDESLFQKMLSEEQRQRERREEEERAEERRQREEEARELLEEEAKGEAHWAVVRQKLGQELERTTSVGFVGVMEGVIPEASAGGANDEQEEDEGGGERHRGSGATGEQRAPDDHEQDSTASDDSWMNDPEDYNNNNNNDNATAIGESPAAMGGVEGGNGGVKERSSWYRSQFKELENLGKGGFGTVVKVRNRVDRRLYAVKKVGLDPFDKETNRKIRREVTTISTLIHKNIVRYYQAWLEGGGGAMPAAVEEEDHSADDEEGDDNGDDNSIQEDEGDAVTGLPPEKGTPGSFTTATGDASTRISGGNANGASIAAAAGRGALRARSVDQPEEGDDDEDEEDQSEAEAGMGFFRTPSRPSRGSTTKVSKQALEGRRSVGDAARGATREGGGIANAGAIFPASEDEGAAFGDEDGIGGGDEFGSGRKKRAVLFRTGQGGSGGGEGQREEKVVLGRKAKRLLRKQARKNKRLLGAAAAADGGSGAAGVADLSRKGAKGRGASPSLRARVGGEKQFAVASNSAADTAMASNKGHVVRHPPPQPQPQKAPRLPPEAPWAKKRDGTMHSDALASTSARATSLSFASSSPSTSSSSYSSSSSSSSSSSDDRGDKSESETASRRPPSVDWSDEDGSG
ncbi:unnamed protein product, partial [Scytosiphon promiscuus]